MSRPQGPLPLPDEGFRWYARRVRASVPGQEAEADRGVEMTFPTSRAAAIVAVGLFAAFAAATLALRPLMPIDETRYLAVAWEMWRDGSWMLPRLNGEAYPHKPPLLFWLIGLVWAAGGVSELGARLVAPSFALLAVGLTWLLARRLWPAEPGRAGLAALILASSGLFLFFGSTTMFDAPLAAAVLWAMLALLRLRRGGGRGAVLSFGAALALGAYAKGPVILLHVAPVALLMPLWADPATRPPLRRWLARLGASLLVALGLVALWLVPALVLGGADYRTEVLWTQSAGRLAESFAHRQPFWFYFALLPLLLWPWGWTPGGFAALSPRRLRAEEPARFLALWALGALLAFSLVSGKQAHYLLPEMPALALLLSGMALPRGVPLWARVPPLLPAGGIVAVVAAVGLGLVPEALANGAGLAWPTLVAAALILLALLAAALRLPEAWPGLLLVAPLTLLALLAAASPLLFAGYDARPIGRLLASHESRGLAFVGDRYHGQFTFAGRLRGPATVLDAAGLRGWASAHPGGLVLMEDAEAPLPLDEVGRRMIHGKDYRLYRVPETPS